MSSEPSKPPSTESEPSARHFEFVRQTYDTHQSIIRQLDAKAGVMIGVLTLLLAGLLPLTKDVPSKLCLTGKGAPTSYCFLLAAITFVISFLLTAWNVQNVIIPRHGTSQSERGLMYALQILRHEHKANYHEALAATTSATLFEHMAHNIFELSAIEQQKMKALSKAHWPIIVSLFSWSATAILTIYISSWR
jgi:hypothetical protein